MKRFLLSLALLFSLCGQALGAVTVGTAASIDGPTINGATATISVDAGSDTNRLMVALVYNSVGNMNNITCTYAGAAMTRIGTNDNVATGIYYRVAPTTGANNLVCTIDGTVFSSQSFVVGVPMSGVDQATPVGTRTTTTGTGSPISISVDSVSGDLVIDIAGGTHSGGGGSITVDASQTSRAEADAFDGGAGSAGVSTEVASGTSTTMSWTWAAPADWRASGVAIKPAAGGGGGGPIIRRRVQ